MLLTQSTVKWWSSSPSSFFNFRTKSGGGGMDLLGPPIHTALATI